MKIIGVTGKSGSGKTTFASKLAEKLNCDYIDIDKISHMPYKKPEIIHILCKEFGNGILDESGNIDREKLGDIVFSKEENMNKLIQITQRDAEQELDTILLRADNKIIVLEWIKLPASKYWQKCSIKILVKTNDTKRKQRVIQRDGISKEYFKKRDSAAIDYEETEFDYIFKNDNNKEEMEEAIHIISNKIMED